MAQIKGRTAAPPLTFETRRTLVENLQEQTAQKLLGAELGALNAAGRQRPGFSSLYGRFAGIWKNEEALKKLIGDVPDTAPDFE